MHLKASYLIIITLLFSACSTEEGGGEEINSISNLEPIKQFDSDINGITSGIRDEDKSDVQLELAFGKILAHSLNNVLFKDYLKSQMANPDKCFFKELLLAEHIDSELANGLTIRALLNEVQDEEVNSIIESNLISEILSKQPMLSLKFSDKVKTLDWNTDLQTPVVYVKSKVGLIDSNLLKFRIYGANGYSEDVFWKSELEYLSIVSGYSQHYILYNENDWTNELGIPLTMQFPELKVDWGYYEPRLKEISRNHPSYNGSILDKYEVYYLIDEYYRQNNFNYSLVDQNNCNNLTCPRINCYDKDTLNTIFSEIDISSTGRLAAIGNPDLFENIGFYYKSVKDDFKTGTNEIFYEITTNGRKYCEVFPTPDNIEISQKTIEVNDIILPRLSFDNVTQIGISRNLSINRFMFSGWPIDGESYDEIVSNGEIFSRSDHIIFGAFINQFNYTILNIDSNESITASSLSFNTNGFELDPCLREKTCEAFGFNYCLEF